MVRRSCCLVAWIVGSAAISGRGADYSFFFTVSNAVSPEQPSATVTMWAAFDPQWYAFGLSHTEVWGPPDPGGFSDPEALIYQKKYCDPGDVALDGHSITGIRITQYHFLLGQLADPHNPLELWSATWTTDDFSPREVPIWTQSSDFYVYTNDGGHWENFYGPDFSEGSGVIEVIPAPAAAAILAGAGLGNIRRRRGHNRRVK
jgi:hypothetical protein